MPPRERIDQIHHQEDACRLSLEWGISLATIDLLVQAANQYWDETRGRVTLISGYRTRAEQAELGRAGRPAAADNLSTHRSCPATGADISLGDFPTRAQIATWGRIAVMNGLRWGGGSPVDEVGIPSDWGHVDMGRRTS